MYVNDWLEKHKSKYGTREELVKKCMKTCSVQRETVLKKLRKLEKSSIPLPNDQDEQKKAKTRDEVEIDLGRENGTVTTRSLNIKTPAQALKVSEIDLEKWEIDRQVVNTWEVTMGAQKTATGKAETYTNYQVKVWLRRKVVPELEIAIGNLLNRYKPTAYPKIKRVKQKNPNMLEVCLFDHHFGKLAWRKETGLDYDLKIARSLYHSALCDLLNKTNSFEIEKIVFPIGQDFFHINDPTNLTPKGKNKLDTDGRLAKVFEYGIEACIKAVETCLTVAPVEIIWVPGNHDPETSYYLCKVLQAHFRTLTDVNVDVAPHSRKYKRYGVSLIGYTHGDEEPHRDLPHVMADEKKKDWAETEFHEWHIGHLHKKKQTYYTGSDTYGSTAVRVLPSLTGADYWHYKKGYVKGNRAAEAYIWNKVTGYVGHFSTNLIDLNLAHLDKNE